MRTDSLALIQSSRRERSVLQFLTVCANAEYEHLLVRDFEIMRHIEMRKFLFRKTSHLSADFAEQVRMSARAFAFDILVGAKAPDAICALDLMHQPGIFEQRQDSIDRDAVEFLFAEQSNQIEM